MGATQLGNLLNIKPAGGGVGSGGGRGGGMKVHRCDVAQWAVLRGRGGRYKRLQL